MRLSTVNSATCGLPTEPDRGGDEVLAGAPGEARRSLNGDAGRQHRRPGRSGASYGSTELHLLLREPGGVAERLFDVFALQVRVAREHLIETWLNAAPVASSLPRSFGNAGRRSARGALESAGAPPNASSEPGSPGRRRAARALGAPPRTCGTSGLPSVVAEGELRLQVGRVGVVDRPQRVLLHPVEHARRGDVYGEAAQHEGLALDVLESECLADARDEIDGEPVRGAVAHDGVLTGEVLGANLLNLGIVPHPRQRTPQAFDVVGRRFDEEVDILREARNPVQIDRLSAEEHVADPLVLERSKEVGQPVNPVQIDRLSAEEHVADPLVLERSKEVGQPVESRWHSRSQDSAWCGALTAMSLIPTHLRAGAWVNAGVSGRRAAARGASRLSRGRARRRRSAARARAMSTSQRVLPGRPGSWNSSTCS